MAHLSYIIDMDFANIIPCSDEISVLMPATFIECNLPLHMCTGRGYLCVIVEIPEI